MQDIEFTVQKGKLYMLQTRNGKRTGAAAVRIAVEMVNEGLIDQKEAVAARRSRRRSTSCCSRCSIPKAHASTLLGQGPPRQPRRGGRQGRLHRRRSRESRAAERTKTVILVRSETSPEDIRGMHVAEGILTARGGMTSHAAVVARGMGKACVVGAGALTVDDNAQTIAAGGNTVKRRRHRSPSTARPAKSWSARSPTDRAERCPAISAPLMELGRRDPHAQGPHQRRHARRRRGRAQVRRRRHRPVPHRAHVLRRERIDAMREMILADDEAGRASRAGQAAAVSSASDFVGIFTRSWTACR